MAPAALISTGTGTIRQKFNPGSIQFRARSEIVVPYLALDYSNGGKAFPIKEVILGPKNENLTTNIEVFLNTLGITDVTIRKSKASHR